MISSNSFKFPYGNGLIHFKAAAAFFTRMGADTAKYTGQWEIPHDDFNGFPVLSLLHHLHITLHIQVSRAGQSTGGLIEFFYAKGARNGLGIRSVNGLAAPQTHIILAGSHNRTYLGAVATACAFIKIKIAGVLLKCYLKVSLFSVNVENI